MSDSNPPHSDRLDDNFSIELRELWPRLLQGLPQTLGLIALAVAVASGAFFFINPFTNATTSARITFSFKGYERGLYPDDSNFQADDLRSPEIIATALNRIGGENSELAQSIVRSALSIEGLIPPGVVEERDRISASGQKLPPIIPDEYQLTLILPRKFELSSSDRARLLNEIVSVYTERFQRTYVSVPLSLGTVFESLDGSDYFDYELVLGREGLNIIQFLNQMLDSAPSFRSPRSNMSFADLLNQAELFTQIKLNETLGIIRAYGVSGDRQIAMLKIDYHLRSLRDQEREAVEQESLVMSLLQQSQNRDQNHVLGIKSQTTQNQNSPLIDQGLIDSLLANDAYGFLIRKALEVGSRTREIQSEISILDERRSLMGSFTEADDDLQEDVISQLVFSLDNLKSAYNKLIEDIRTTHEDFQQQVFGNAVRLTMQATTSSFYLALAKAGIVGGFIGAAAGIGLSLLGLTGKRRRRL